MTKIKQRANNREKALLDAAATQFAANGYRGTTIRTISESVDMLPGSVYYHFSSKHELLLSVYGEGVQRIATRLQEAIANRSDPWARLEAAVVAHMETVLDQSDYARVIISVLPEQVPQLTDKLIKLRDSYEALFKHLVNDLPLNARTNPTMLRLFLIGAMNWSQAWYHEGQETPAKIGRNFVRMIKDSTAKN